MTEHAFMLETALRGGHGRQTGLRALATTIAAVLLAWGLLSQEGLRMRETEQQYLPI